MPSSREVLREEEIAATSAVTAFDAVRLRRPAFLQTRGPKSFTTIRSVYAVVYLNDMFYGEIESLNNIAALDIKEIQWIDPSDATIRWGTGHSGGVILVITKR